jgi:hypothetical protein
VGLYKAIERCSEPEGVEHVVDIDDAVERGDGELVVVGRELQVTDLLDAVAELAPARARFVDAVAP